MTRICTSTASDANGTSLRFSGDPQKPNGSWGHGRWDAVPDLRQRPATARDGSKRSLPQLALPPIYNPDDRRSGAGAILSAFPRERKQTAALVIDVLDAGPKRGAGSLTEYLDI